MRKSVPLGLLLGLLLATPALLPACGGSDPAPATADLANFDRDMLEPFGAVCTVNEECTSKVCFIGGNRSYCSMHCTTATATTDCPNPPTTGMCNMQGFCKAP